MKTEHRPAEAIGSHLVRPLSTWILGSRLDVTARRLAADLKCVAHNCYVEGRTAMAPNWDDVSFVIGSTYRVAVLSQLMTGPAVPSQIAADADIAFSHVSRALGELREQGFVELLVSEERQKGRVYGITDHGTEVWETIEEHNLAEAHGRPEA